MTLIDDIARMEAATKTQVASEDKPTKQLPSKITLDTRLDPDPYGYHGIPLADRLRAMGWP